MKYVSNNHFDFFTDFYYQKYVSHCSLIVEKNEEELFIKQSKKEKKIPFGPFKKKNQQCKSGSNVSKRHSEKGKSKESFKKWY